MKIYLVFGVLVLLEQSLYIVIDPVISQTEREHHLAFVLELRQFYLKLPFVFQEQLPFKPHVVFMAVFDVDLVGDGLAVFFCNRGHVLLFGCVR
mgnify:CR=1 FL=1